MSVGDFLALCGEILLLFITVLTCVDLARVRDRARLDIALVFIALAIDVVPRLLPRLGIEPGLLTLDQPLASVVHPYLLLRLVDHFRPIRGLVSWGAMALVLAAWGFHLFAPEPIVFSWGWTVAAIFTILTLYAAGAVASAAERGQSVARPTRRARVLVEEGGERSRLVAIGDASAGLRSSITTWGRLLLLLLLLLLRIVLVGQVGD